jgi:hypothetical protein
MLSSTPVSSCAGDASFGSTRAIRREFIGRLVKASTNESSRGSPILSKTDAPQQRSAGPSETSWASKCTGSKADLPIPATSASTAARNFHQLRRSTNISGDVLRGRNQTRINLPNERGHSWKALSQPKVIPESTMRNSDIKTCRLKKSDLESTFLLLNDYLNYNLHY